MISEWLIIIWIELLNCDIRNRFRYR